MLPITSHGIKALLLNKAVGWALTFSSGLCAWIATEIPTQNMWIGVGATSAATIIVGLLTSYPRWIKARGDDWAAIVREMREQHSQRLAVLERQVAFQNRERVLMRSTKHKLAGYLQYAQHHITLLEIECKHKGVDFEGYNLVNVSEAFKEEDDAMQELTTIQLNSLPSFPPEQ